jgi:hypothetical protein
MYIYSQISVTADIWGGMSLEKSDWFGKQEEAEREHLIGKLLQKAMFEEQRKYFYTVDITAGREMLLSKLVPDNPPKPCC